MFTEWRGLASSLMSRRVVAPADARPKLEIENRLLAGSTAGGQALVGRVAFGGDPLGRIAIPSGELYSRIALKKQ